MSASKEDGGSRNARQKEWAGLLQVLSFSIASIRFRFIRETSFFDIGIVFAYSGSYGLRERCIPANKTRMKFLGQSQKVVHNKDLPITMFTGANPDR